MEKFIHLVLKPAFLEHYGLPNIPYPFPMEGVDTLPNQELPLALMLYSLQQCTSVGDADWQQMEQGMERLAQLLAPEDLRPVITTAGDTWWLEIGPVNLDGALVTIQRGETLIAAIASREDGRIRVSVYRPLDAKSLEYLINLGMNPHPDCGVCMRETNWAYALDCSAGMGNVHAFQRGEAYLSYWEKGLGISSDGREVPTWRLQGELVLRFPVHGATELGIHYTFYE